MESQPAGYREIEHTADWELEVWAPTLPVLLEQAAQGMYALSGARLRPRPRLQRTLEFAAPDPESLLVSFLAELLFCGEQEGVGFDTFFCRMDGDRLLAELSGAPIASLDKEIKAVTYHNLKILQTGRGMKTRIVFDV